MDRLLNSILFKLKASSEGVEYTTIFYLVLSHKYINLRLAENGNCLKPLAYSLYGEAREESQWFSITYTPVVL